MWNCFLVCVAALFDVCRSITYCDVMTRECLVWHWWCSNGLEENFIPVAFMIYETLSLCSWSPRKLDTPLFVTRKLDASTACVTFRTAHENQSETHPWLIHLWWNPSILSLSSRSEGFMCVSLRLQGVYLLLLYQNQQSVPLVFDKSRLRWAVEVLYGGGWVMPCCPLSRPPQMMDYKRECVDV